MTAAFGARVAGSRLEVLNVTFLVPSAKRIVGGVLSLYEFANGLSRRGHGVTLAHLPVIEGHIDRVEDLEWFSFEPGVQHRVVASLADVQLPDADFVEVTAQKSFADAWPDGAGRAELPASAGLPFVFVQGCGIFSAAIEAGVFGVRGPKVCIARWMIDAVHETGVPRKEQEYIPYGLDHATFRLTRPIADRPAQVAMLYNPHPAKGARYGLAAIETVRRRMPDVRAVVFGNTQLVDDLPPGVTYVEAPSREVLVDEIYNASRVFICSSVHEGFGMCAIEAMAGGCALVTTNNGGASDYAYGGENALVCAPRDVEGLADRIERLLRDDALRVEIATRGEESVRRFDWDESAARLEDLLGRYGANPGYYRRVAS